MADSNGQQKGVASMSSSFLLLSVLLHLKGATNTQHEQSIPLTLHGFTKHDFAK